MKKLIFLFDQPKSTIVQVDTLTQYFNISSIENDLIFCEPKLFHLRLIQIINKNNKSLTIFNEIIFVFNGELDKENSTIVRNKFLDQISYKEQYINVDLNKVFTPYIKSNKKIRLISHIDFYHGIKKQLNKNNYPSLIIYDGSSVDVELALSKDISVNLNADIKEIDKLDDITATEALSIEKLLKNLYGSKKDITNIYSSQLLEVIKFFRKLSFNKVKEINSILIYSTKSELIKSGFLSDKLNMVVKVVNVSDLLYASKNRLTESNKRSNYSDDEYSFWDYIGYISEPIRNVAERVRDLAANLYLRVSEKQEIGSHYNKFEDSNSITTIYFYSANGEFIREFKSYNAFQNFLERNYESIDDESYFEFYDNYDGFEVLTVRELKRISIFSNLKSKIERSLFG